jgi:hypothetical protein
MLLTSSSRQLSQETGSSLHAPLSSVTVLLPPSWLHTECSAHLSLAPPSHTARPDILVGEKRKKFKYLEARGAIGILARSFQLLAIFAGWVGNKFDLIKKIQFFINSTFSCKILNSFKAEKRGKHKAERNCYIFWLTRQNYLDRS